MSCNLYFLRDLFNIYIWGRIHRSPIDCIINPLNIIVKMFSESDRISKCYSESSYCHILFAEILFNVKFKCYDSSYNTY